MSVHAYTHKELIESVCFQIYKHEHLNRILEAKRIDEKYSTGLGPLLDFSLINLLNAAEEGFDNGTFKLIVSDLKIYKAEADEVEILKLFRQGFTKSKFCPFHLRVSGFYNKERILQYLIDNI